MHDTSKSRLPGQQLDKARLEYKDPNREEPKEEHVDQYRFIHSSFLAK
jgi:hypothetical protein